MVPELVNSVKVLTDNAPSYINRLMQETTKLLEKWNVTQEQINALKLDWSSILTQATQVTTNFMGSVFNITVNVANGIFIMAMSFIFCMYMLVNKEKLTTNLKRVMYAYLPNRVAKRTIDVAILSNKIFSNFVRGQLTEACIWFFLIYLGMTVLRLPYALLISAIVALCSLIPIIGPYISMFTAGFILLLVNPWHTLTYLIFFPESFLSSVSFCFGKGICPQHLTLPKTPFPLALSWALHIFTRLFSSGAGRKYPFPSCRLMI